MITDNKYLIKREKFPTELTRKIPNANRCLVLLSTYNGEKYIKEQLLSILFQEGVVCDLLVRDDGSTDNTKIILDELCLNYPNRIKVLYEKNKGIHYSFGKLIELAGDDYDFYAFSDQDDVWDLDKLCLSVISLKQNNADFYSCCARLVDSAGNNMGRDTSSEKTYTFYMNSPHKIMTPGAQGCTMVLTHDLIKDIRMKQIPKQYGHDTWIPIIAYYFYGCIYDANPHMSYRQHDNSWTGNRKKRIKQYWISLQYFVKGLSRYQDLAEDIGERYFDRLSDEEKIYLMGLANKGNLFNRICYMHKCKYAKCGGLETIVFRLYYLLTNRNNERNSDEKVFK